MIFTAAQVRAIREGKMTGTLTTCSENLRVGSVRLLRRCDVTAAIARRPSGRPTRREVSAYIDARLDLDPVEIVCDVLPDGERRAVVFTVLAVQDLEVATLTLRDVRPCGCQTTNDLRYLRAGWRCEHPRSELARLVGFALGDWRDRPPLLISAYWPDYTRDPSRAMFDEPEPISRREQSLLAADAQQRFARHQADRSRAQMASTASERLAAIQRGAVVRPG